MKLARASVWFLRAIPVVCLLGACLGQEDGDAGLTMAITDAPIDGATAVVVQISGLVLKPADGAERRIDFTPAKVVDLLALQGGGSDILIENQKVPAGAYTSAVLLLDAAADGIMDSYVTLSDGSQHELVLAQGATTRANATYVVPDTGAARYTIDFDLRKSVTGTDTSGNFVLNPVLRIVADSQVGGISGTIDGMMRGGSCSPAVYVFNGADVTPDDIDGSSPDPVASSGVDPESGHYAVAYLPAGDYTVAYTCEAASDKPDSSEDIGFVSQNASVVAGQATQIDFAGSGGGGGGGGGGGSGCCGDECGDGSQPDHDC